MATTIDGNHSSARQIGKCQANNCPATKTDEENIIMEFGPNASLHSMNSQNRHDDRRAPVSNNVRQQVRDYNRANSKPGTVSRVIATVGAYELVGSIAAIAVLGSVFTVVIK